MKVMKVAIEETSLNLRKFELVIIVLLIDIIYKKKKIFRYVCPEYQNCFINLMGIKVLSQIIVNVKNAGVWLKWMKIKN